MALVLDAGALIAVERGNHAAVTLLQNAQRRGVALVASSAAVAQAWRGGARQARLARLLPSVGEEALGPNRSRRVGGPLAANGTTDVVDAARVDLAMDGDEVLTGDLEEIARLVRPPGGTS